jgi:hypothetical protein
LPGQQLSCTYARISQIAEIYKPLRNRTYLIWAQRQSTRGYPPTDATELHLNGHRGYLIIVVAAGRLLTRVIKYPLEQLPTKYPNVEEKCHDLRVELSVHGAKR